MDICFSCGKDIKENEAALKTPTNLPCHRACLQGLLDTHRDSNDSRSVPEFMSSSVKTKATDSVRKSASNTQQLNEEGWECKGCSKKNLTSNKRCQSCGIPRTNRYTTTIEEEYSSSSTSGAPKTPDPHSSAKSGKKINTYEDEDDDDDDYHGTMGAAAKGVYDQQPEKEKAKGVKYDKEKSYYDDDDDDDYRKTKGAAAKRVYDQQPEKEKAKGVKYDKEKSYYDDDDDDDYHGTKGAAVKSAYDRQPEKEKVKATKHDKEKSYYDDDDDDYRGTKGAAGKGASDQQPDKEKIKGAKYEKLKSYVDDDNHSPTHQSRSMPSIDKKPTKARSPSPSTSKPLQTVYISDLPSDSSDSYGLETLIARRIEDLAFMKPKKVKCYLKLGIGVIHVANNDLKDRLLNKIGKIALDPKRGKDFITIVETIELISYVVLNVTKELQDEQLPTAKEVSYRWLEVHKGEKPLLSCDILNAQFSNIYRVVSSSLEELTSASSNGTFRIKNFLGDIYYCADSCFFDDLPRTVKKQHLHDAIAREIGESDLPSTSLYVQINRHSGSACIISANVARLWSTKSFVIVDKITLQKKTKLACRLVLHPIPKSCSIQSIIKHREFRNAVIHHKLIGDHLILELSDEDAFEKCLDRGALRIDNDTVLTVDLCNTLNNPDGGEIDDDTWYEREMLEIKPDIMQFVANPKHKIFRYRWNSHLWNEEFERVKNQKRDPAHGTSHDPKKPTPDQIRHLLRVTVMLNTLGVIKKRSFMIEDREIQLNLKNELKTIVYNHESTLERTEKLNFTKTPYSRTTIRVVRNDCLHEYERMTRMGKRPVLLNMASATSPGGGFRKGDGAQEENIFRRSDYCRSLDIGLDDFLKERADRFHCTSESRLDRISDPNNMYPMNEYGAIYTTGITVFRQTEEKGYAFMENPLENVCSIAMAAYRDPELKGNFLAPKFAVGTRKKIENIFAIAHHHNHDCLILSALGCGAFKNPPEHVAKIFYSVIEQYAGFFDTIVFAIVDDHNAGRQLNPEGNYQPFATILDGQTVEPNTAMNKSNTIIGPYRLLSDGVTVANVTIFDQTPCNYGAKCTEMYKHQHSNQFSHPPLCIQAAINGKCKRTDDIVHTTSFIHRNQCRDGGLCQRIHEENHTREFDHPDYCPDEGRCQKQNDEHLRQYRHLPLCEKAHKCMEYRKEVASHCSKFRHCAPRCPHGGLCVMFHDKNHLEEFQHPFASPCPRTPFDCPHFMKLSGAIDTRSLSHNTQNHCMKYAHVCRNGRKCTDNTPLHLAKTIHIARHVCTSQDKCKRLDDEEHLNSFSHPNVPDIRPACQYDSACRELRKFDHKVSFRHPSVQQGGVVQYYGSNENTDFVQNQKNNMLAVEQYITKNSWKPLPSGSIPNEILSWIRNVQPIHRCSPLIFESIFLHGHIMSREYMENLKDPTFVANSVLHHSRIQRIEELKTTVCHEDAKLYVTALVALEFENNDFARATVVPPALLGADTGKGASPYTTKETYEHMIKKKEIKLSKTISKANFNALRTKAIEIAQASIRLHSDPAGIGHPPDKALGTDKQVFSVLGPNLGHYYGDVIIVFKREILHHPDANYSMQAATSFVSGNAYKWRPWLGNDSGNVDKRVQHYHSTKLHASVSGYEYATALELIALTSLRTKANTMDVTLDEILQQWIKNDPHHNIEAHLPQLIPLDYIDHIYIPKNLFSALSEVTLKAIDALFKHRITLVPHDGQADHERGPFGPTPNLKSRSEYQNFVVKELTKQYKENATHSLSHSVKGVVITVSSLSFNDHYVLPLTISQAYTQYRIEKLHHTSKDNITYIYWKVMYGDMMLTLCNEEIDINEDQPDLRCLVCYIAPKPQINDDDDDYHEKYSYLAAAHPFKHSTIVSKKSYKAKANTLYLGCNSNDFMTFCLQLHRSTGKVVLSHAGPNGIYNHEEISCTFGRSELDLSKMEYVHVSAGAHSVPIRNVMISFEKQSNMHPTFDKDYERDTSSAAENKPSKERADNNNHKSSDASHGASSNVDDNKSPKTPGFIGKVANFIFGDNDSKIKPCPENVNCSKQYSEDTKKDHNAKYSHPCPYSERCRDKDSHSTHTHEPHNVPKCREDEACKKLDDPCHRASYRHTGRPDYLFPCYRQNTCSDKSYPHRMKYSHGEQVFEKSSTSAPSST
ncbi:hypothetical protein I4U23_003738 [Adineta vaga]|nr:hypothetical protein I4U23_003738 [Adineta vaga]